MLRGFDLAEAPSSICEYLHIFAWFFGLFRRFGSKEMPTFAAFFFEHHVPTLTYLDQ